MVVYAQTALCRWKPLLESLLEVDSEKRPASASAALDTLRSIGVPGGAPFVTDEEQQFPGFGREGPSDSVVVHVVTVRP